jgi:hypothetical protein
MTSLKEIRFPNVSTRTMAEADVEEFELESDAPVATLEAGKQKKEPAKATGASTGHAGLFTVDLLGGWCKP